MKGELIYDLSAILFHCALKGAWGSWGSTFAFIDPLRNNGGSAKHNRLFWCTSEALSLLTTIARRSKSLVHGTN